MESKPTKDELQSQLSQTADAMSSRLSSIQEEVSTTGSSVRDWVKAHPLESVGGMIVAGLAVGLLFGGTKRKRRRRHQKLIDQYVDALSDELDEAKSRGEEPSKALETALRDRVPLVVYAGNDRNDDRGVIRSTFGDGMRAFIRTAVSITAGEFIRNMLADMDLDDLNPDDLGGEE